jgi:hypothetical protein
VSCLRRYDLATRRWWWSTETYRIHGFEPHEVVPTTDLVLAHKHPADREQFWQAFESAQVSAEPFHSVHRMMDAHGAVQELSEFETCSGWTDTVRR